MEHVYRAVDLIGLQRIMWSMGSEIIRKARNASVLLRRSLLLGKEINFTAINFTVILYFYTHWKRRKTRGFLMFSEFIWIEYWSKLIGVLSGCSLLLISLTWCCLSMVEHLIKYALFIFELWKKNKKCAERK